MPNPEQMRAVRERATLLIAKEDVERGFDRLATELNLAFDDKNPVILALMKGGLVTAGILIPRLNFPLELDYVHATRYGDTTAGGALAWERPVPEKITNRHVLIIDDLLDHGVTLQHVISACKKLAPISITTAVLLKKDLSPREGIDDVDYFAVEIPNKYVFGYGMDYHGYWRNADGIYAVADEDI